MVAFIRQFKIKYFISEVFSSFSASYEKYLTLGDVQDHFDFAGLPDIFIPVKKAPLILILKLILPPIILAKVLVIEGILANRKNLRSRAILFQNSDSAKSCYTEKEYRLLSVEIKYEIVDKTHHFVPCFYPVNLKTQGKAISFTFIEKKIRIRSIYVLDENNSLQEE